MPPAKKKRKTAASSKAKVPEPEVVEEPQAVAQLPEETQDADEAEAVPETAAEKPEINEAPIEEAEPPAAPAPEEPAMPPPPAASSSKPPPQPPVDAAAKAQERMDRFKALQARAKQSSTQNLKAAAAESHRIAADPAQLNTIQRKHAIASQKLLKAEIEDAGGDFERKRAWDWTAEESEKWDKRMRKKEANADNNAFQDYRSEAQKVYKRQLKNMAPDMEKYARERLAAVEKAAASGSLEIVETEDGELVAVDRDGSFYATANSTGFAENKPSKAAIDRLVNDQRKADEVAARKRAEREAKNGDDADITYINEKNKQFNQKLDRFYNKYTAEIRDSFERGTMI